ncbi:MAG: MotA/TolQ/ExbB proton channel family protein [Sandaracinaceae bacterium]|nr:MotA/TolQ/ExbB proton channel family protein [Sandaracinaceae bacterium]
MNIVEQLMHVALLGSAWVLYLLFGLSIISIGAILERALFFRRNRRGAAGLREGIDQALRGRSIADLETTLAKFQSVEVDVLRGALDYRRGGPDAFLEAVDARIERERARLENSMTFLGTLGNNAPFVGLFGTVIGVIEAFQHLSAGNGAGMDNVMAGIAEALIATGVGIFVALPAVVAFNVGQKRASDIEGETLSPGARPAPPPPADIAGLAARPTARPALTSPSKGAAEPWPVPRPAAVAVVAAAA